MRQQRTFALGDLCDSTAVGSGVVWSSTTRASLFSGSSGNSVRLFLACPLLSLQNLTVQLIALIVSTDKQRPPQSRLVFAKSLRHILFLHHTPIRYFSQYSVTARYSSMALPLYCGSRFLNSAFLCIESALSWDYHTVNPFHAQSNLLVSWRTRTYNVILTTLTPPVSLHWVALKITVSGEMTKQDVRV